ncbi:MAG: hemolysin III family protein [Deltaproteobacteria bacterium]|nr:hemolysin III family protein [Deltaproteobacteria bacterium]
MPSRMASAHGLGVLLGIAALAILVTFAALAGDAMRVVAFAIYGSSLVLLYLASTCYHAFSAPRVKRFFRILDHAAIYLLIAGTYTPVALVTLKGGWGWTLFGLVWGLAVLGIGATVFLVGRFKVLSLGIYIAMGWIVVIAGKPLIAAMPTGGLMWLFGGGLAYTGGAFVYASKRLPFNHAIWHLFVLLGSICHFFCILFYVLPRSL